MVLPEGYVVNRATQNWQGYYLSDGIYFGWSIFLKPRSAPASDREKHLAICKRAKRKDIESLIGVLQGRIQILSL